MPRQLEWQSFTTIGLAGNYALTSVTVDSALKIRCGAVPNNGGVSTPVANYVPGFSTRQLNGNPTYPTNGVTDDQLRT